MSGVVNTVKNTASSVGSAAADTVGDIFKNPIKGLGEAGSMYVGTMTGGAFSGLAAQKTAKGVAEGNGIIPSASAANQSVLTSTGLGDTIFGAKPTAPNITVQDPNAVASQQAAARAAAARQAQIDQKTSTPGRGGTILTDNYQYKT